MSNKSLFHLKNGIIVACDVHGTTELLRIVSNTSDITGIVGYKIGCSLVLKYGLTHLTSKIREQSGLPIIYDHQKAGTDIPQIAREFAKECSDGGVDGVILFPQAGPATEVEFVNKLFEFKLIPLVGGEMTHIKYLNSDGGFISDTAPIEMYRIAAEMQVEYFIVPGTNPEMIYKYSKVLSEIVKNPKFCFPGIGRQGGDILKALEAANGNPAYAIIGSAIYRSKDIRESAKELCDIVLKYGA